MSVRMKGKERNLSGNLLRIAAVSGNSVLKEHGFLGVSHGNVLFIFTEGQMEEVSLDQFLNVVLIIKINNLKEERIERLFLKLVVNKKASFHIYVFNGANFACPGDINICLNLFIISVSLFPFVRSSKSA